MMGLPYRRTRQLPSSAAPFLLRVDRVTARHVDLRQADEIITLITRAVVGQASPLLR